jgi:hypothetical protein
MTLSRNNYDEIPPDYISVVAIDNEDKQIAGSITISSFHRLKNYHYQFVIKTAFIISVSPSACNLPLNR